MTVNELIKQLQEQKKSHGGNISVRVLIENSEVDIRSSMIVFASAGKPSDHYAESRIVIEVG